MLLLDPCFYGGTCTGVSGLRLIGVLYVQHSFSHLDACALNVEDLIIGLTYGIPEDIVRRNL